ncbi:hypothetical protein ATF69_4312 [Acidovorax delafieldii]|jgi:hypothetical protein|uniref:Uncharacterized protein n=1 Tax=Acidovorax delafieldii TaxID=47920 RepID=A0A561XAW4_ACIDE|nr:MULTISPECIES: hypothetical protein [Acidovorax]KRA06705.1 hypothetical protein ASD75_15990 [Acidovorax sp. Root568]TWG33236.1 hypothetical protein ATF69_4312 [Acidovorax delafieldii]
MLMSAAASTLFFAPIRALAPALADPAPAPAPSVIPPPRRPDAAPHSADADCQAHHTYWPCELLNAFVLRMAAHGHCVNMSMMLGHRPYALERLALASGVPDAGLQELSAQLQPYFEAPVLQAESPEPRPATPGDGATAGSGSPHASTQTLLRPWPLAS